MKGRIFIVTLATAALLSSSAFAKNTFGHAPGMIGAAVAVVHQSANGSSWGGQGGSNIALVSQTVTVGSPGAITVSVNGSPISFKLGGFGF